jgi:predicted AAA+ superfamily ATPase
MNYSRPLYTTLLATLSRPTPVIHVLIGPRQVGKTTIARQIEHAIDIPTLYATADSPVPYGLGLGGWDAGAKQPEKNLFEKSQGQA